MPIAFISHSSQDDRYVAELEQFVRGLGYDEVFNDVRSIEPGAEFWPRIEEGIRQCDAFVVVLTEASAGSDWVDREVEFARAEGKKEIPIWIEDCKLPACYEGRDVVDLRPGRRERRKIAASRILRHSPAKLFGRETWFDDLDAAWAAHDAVNVYTLVAWGGVGKTSLVAHWIAERMAARGWPGVERYFDWSFYSQGTGESRQTSSDFFIAEALRFFGDPDQTVGSPWERGQRLAELVRNYRTLLVLDGIEPLQYPVNDASGQAGMLKDQGLESLLQGLATDNPGLCVVTTRETVANLRTFRNSTAPEKKLDSLPREAAIALLRHLQIVGTEEELEAAWRDAGGHALTLQLLGRFIVDAFPDRDIRHRAEVKFEAADLERQGRSAFKVMVAYERWLQSAGPERQRELAILRLTGLFDRPISPDCLAALRAEPAIDGLTDTIVRLTDAEWNIALTRLSSIDLISLTHDQSAIRNPNSATTLDAHPLIREYFAVQLREQQPAAFRAAHSRLFDHLCGTKPHQPDTLDGLQPLYQAVVHGCLAERQQEACDKVYFVRILRGGGPGGNYSQRKLGAIGANLAAVAAFFDQPWSRLSPNLSEVTQAWLLNEAAFSLRALGRLTEALEPMRAATDNAAKREQWKNAAIGATNLSELEVTLGRVGDAIEDARRAIELADRRDAEVRVIRGTAAADALHQFGERDEARGLFEQAEATQRVYNREFDQLYSLCGFQYCDLLLAPAERAAWGVVNGRARLLPSRSSGLIAGSSRLGRSLALPESAANSSAGSRPPLADEVATALAEAERRGTRTIRIAERYLGLLDIALDHLTLARVAVYRAILAQSNPHSAFRNRTITSPPPSTASANQGSLKNFPKPSSPPLYLADVHLHRARLFCDKSELAQARTLIDRHGYGRRREELADAEAAADAW